MQDTLIRPLSDHIIDAPLPVAGRGSKVIMGVAGMLTLMWNVEHLRFKLAHDFKVVLSVGPCTASRAPFFLAQWADTSTSRMMSRQ